MSVSPPPAWLPVPITPALPGQSLSVALSGPELPGPGVEDLIRRWLLGKRSQHTRTAYATDMARWLSWCDQLDVDPLLVQCPGRETTGVSRSHVEAWVRSLEAAGAPSSTVARRLSAVSSWYGWLLQGDHVAGSPVEHVTRPEVDRDTSTTPGMTRAQTAALLAAADTDPHENAPRTAAIVAVLLYTGLRVGELLGANVDDLGHNRGHRTLTVTRKGGKRGELALPAPATARLDTYMTSRPDAGTPPLPVTAGGAGSRPRRPLITTAAGRRVDPGTVWRLLRRLARTSPQLEQLHTRLSAHVLRHSFATLYLDAGGNLRDLQDQLGHTEPRTTRRYDRSRGHLDRSPSYTLATYLAASTPGGDGG